jgi:hypothetical protein
MLPQGRGSKIAVLMGFRGLACQLPGGGFSACKLVPRGYGPRGAPRPYWLVQRDRRVFVVAHRGDWRPAAAALFGRDQTH